MEIHGETSPGRATKLVNSLHQHFALLADNARLGRERSDIDPGLRSFPVKGYLIFYRQTSDGVEIARVVHGRMDLTAVFDEPDEE